MFFTEEYNTILSEVKLVFASVAIKLLRSPRTVGKRKGPLE